MAEGSPTAIASDCGPTVMGRRKRLFQATKPWGKGAHETTLLGDSKDQTRLVQNE